MIAYILSAISIIGAIFVLCKNRWGWLIWILSNIGWIGYDIHHGLYGQIPIWIVFIAVSLYGFIDWSTGTYAKEPIKKGQLLTFESTRFGGYVRPARMGDNIIIGVAKEDHEKGDYVDVVLTVGGGKVDRRQKEVHSLESGNDSPEQV